ncbi:hypothetical protein FFH90_021840 [Pseudomonas sp. ATCC 43928]|nr:hypothetical protein FFH90_021840 [Pseudomonas sp. ATCC 43928]
MFARFFQSSFLKHHVSLGVLRCGLCGSAQSLTDAGDINHALGCKAWSLKAQHSSRELPSILHQNIQSLWL